MTFQFRVTGTISSIIMVIICCVRTADISRASSSASSVSKNYERIDDIIKSPNDQRSYRGLILSNRMKVILVSDPYTTKSAACMVLGVGAVNDFRDTPGLANLVGHLLLKGSKKYPRAYSFKNFVRNRGGTLHLPVTSEGEQIFTFDINSNHFLDALDRFAQFFVEPLLAFDEDHRTIFSDAMPYIHFMYSTLGEDDTYLISEVEKLMSKENHPYNHFFLANVSKVDEHNIKDLLEVLQKKKQLHDESGKLFDNIKKFHSMWFSSNIMHLAVLGKESLDDLEKEVTSLFEDVKDTNARRTMFTCRYHPWGPEQLKHKIYIVPHSPGMQQLRLKFPVPDVRDEFDTAPETFVSYFLTHYGRGTLSYELRRMNLCTKLEIEYVASAGISFFVIQCSLTNVNSKVINIIINVIFQYIHMVEEEGIQEWRFIELKQLLEKSYVDWGRHHLSPISSVRYLAQNLALSKISIKNLASFVALRGAGQWKPEAIKQFLSYLQPDRMNVSIISEEFETFARREEKHFGTRYEFERIPEKLIQKWSTRERIPGLRLPPPNEFMPKNFDLYPVDDGAPKYPYIIHESSIAEIWFKQADEFKVPLLSVDFELVSSVINFGPLERVLWILFYNVLTSLLEEYLYTFPIFDFKWVNWKIIPYDHGLHIKLDGYNDKLSIMLEKVLLKMITLAEDVNEKTFNAALIIFNESIKDSFSKDHFSQVDHHTQNMVKYNTWALEHLFNAGKTSYFILQRYNEKPEIFAYSSYFQLNTEPSTFEDVAGYLFYELVEDSCYQILPDESSAAKCLLYNTYGVRGFVIRARTKKEPRQVDIRMEKYLRDVSTRLKKMSSGKFDAYKKKVSIGNECAKPPDLIRSSTKHWHEIGNRYYEFDRTEIECNQLHSFRKIDLILFIQKMLDVSSVRRRKVGVHVFPKDMLQNNRSGIMKNIPNGAIEIEDIMTFKINSTLLPYNFSSVPPTSVP